MSWTKKQTPASLAVAANVQSKRGYEIKIHHKIDGFIDHKFMSFFDLEKMLLKIVAENDPNVETLDIDWNNGQRFFIEHKDSAWYAFNICKFTMDEMSWNEMRVKCISKGLPFSDPRPMRWQYAVENLNTMLKSLH